MACHRSTHPRVPLSILFHRPAPDDGLPRALTHIPRRLRATPDHRCAGLVQHDGQEADLPPSLPFSPGTTPQSRFTNSCSRKVGSPRRPRLFALPPSAGIENLATKTTSPTGVHHPTLTYPDRGLGETNLSKKATVPLSASIGRRPQTGRASPAANNTQPHHAAQLPAPSPPSSRGSLRQEW